jgi:hypothetical protein
MLWGNLAEICGVMLFNTALPGKSRTSDQSNFFNRRCFVQG